ncbi:MAG TPA: class I SAM-dependent methyltransferase [Xanthomonadaceae bacterium]|nr:class I SAM-dependent methyltransferase [Xanthomonadaceae bacterium]
MNQAALGRARATSIAQAFLPSRWHYFYARAKLRSDPLYPGIVDALRDSEAPLLDIGCGIGLLAHVLRDAGLAFPYVGVDNDPGKIAHAQRAALAAGLQAVDFESRDAAAGLLAHHGSVAILDVLQYVEPQAQGALLDAAIGMLTPGAKLVIRTGLEDGSRRARMTRAGDSIGRWLGWMNAGPKRYPDANVLRARFDAAGLHCEFGPLYGRTPFNNWRVVATRPA